ncbi:GntR family transcriptional regulator [Ferrovibrio sp.]|uniref:GntR family transcriptional regulator n=1 Tax=Ferrovibrio sp. TaxID=1917215 RepID=UPI003D2E211F
MEAVLGARLEANDGPRSQTVTDLLRAALLDGRIAPDSRLFELDLCRQFKVSRTPIRAALQTLAGEGLLDYTPNRGYSVRAYTLSEITDTYEMRALAEGLAARLAAERGLTQAQQVEIEQALALVDNALNRHGVDVQTLRSVYTEANRRFHRVIHEAANSRVVVDVVRLFQRVPHTSAHNVVGFGLERVRMRHMDHHAIFEAILCREPKKAEDLMRTHIMTVKNTAARALAQRNIVEEMPAEPQKRRRAPRAKAVAV